MVINYSSKHVRGKLCALIASAMMFISSPFRTSIVIAKETNIYIYIYIYILVSLAITMLVRNLSNGDFFFKKRKKLYILQS